MKKFNFEEFKERALNDKGFVNSITDKKKNDVIDADNGMMLINEENLNKYLEQYSCKNAEDLQDTLWYNYGIYVKIIE